MTKNNTVIERFRENPIIKGGAWNYERAVRLIEQIQEAIDEAYKTGQEDKAKEWQQGYEAGVLQTQGEIVEEIRDWAIIDNGITHKKSFIALWNKLDDIEQMIERR